MTSGLRQGFEAVLTALAIADGQRQPQVPTAGAEALPPWPQALIAQAQKLIASPLGLPAPWREPTSAYPGAIASLVALPQLLISLGAAPPVSADGPASDTAQLAVWLHRSLLGCSGPVPEDGGCSPLGTPLGAPLGAFSPVPDSPAVPVGSVIAEMATIIAPAQGHLGVALSLVRQAGRDRHPGSLELAAVLAAAQGGLTRIPLGWRWHYLQRPAAATGFADRWGLTDPAALAAIAAALYDRWAGIDPQRSSAIPGLPVAIAPCPPKSR